MLESAVSRLWGWLCDGIPDAVATIAKALIKFYPCRAPPKEAVVHSYFPEGYGEAQDRLRCIFLFSYVLKCDSYVCDLSAMIGIWSATSNTTNKMLFPMCFWQISSTEDSKFWPSCLWSFLYNSLGSGHGRTVSPMFPKTYLWVLCRKHMTKCRAGAW